MVVVFTSYKLLNALCMEIEQLRVKNKFSNSTFNVPKKQELSTQNNIILNKIFGFTYKITTQLIN
jgi:hypothetical protein